jgi:hypothetical protein
MTLYDMNPSVSDVFRRYNVMCRTDAQRVALLSFIYSIPFYQEFCIPFSVVETNEVQTCKLFKMQNLDILKYNDKKPGD